MVRDHLFDLVLFVRVAQRAAQVRHDVVDAPERDRLSLTLPLLNEIGKPRTVDPLACDKMLPARRLSDPEDAGSALVEVAAPSEAGSVGRWTTGSGVVSCWAASFSSAGQFAGTPKTSTPRIPLVE